MHGGRFFYEVSSVAMGTAVAVAAAFTVATNTSSYPGTDSLLSFSLSFATQPLQAVYPPCRVYLLKIPPQIHTFVHDGAQPKHSRMLKNVSEIAGVLP